MNMIKTCKVYCTYFDNRRPDVTNNPTNAQEVLAVFRNNIENDKTLDCGVENMDIIIINNYPKVINKECDDYLKSLNNSITPYGKIVVHERENVGASMGAYSYAFDIYGDEYDYWFFCEDDVKVIYPEYFKMIINEFEGDDKLGFLALNLINDEEDRTVTYVSGALGASKKEILKRVKEKYGKLPYDTIVGNNYAGIGHSEVMFTNCYIGMGYEIRTPIKSDVITLADNWEQFSPHTKWQKLKNFKLDNAKFFCHIGF
jgi:hypothetical protein